MNKWKVAFWSCLTLLVVVTIFSAYSIIDQAYTLTYHKVGYEDTEKNLDQLMEIINKTEWKRKQVENELKDRIEFELMECKAYTISLNGGLPIFDNDKRRTGPKQW